MAWNFYGHQPFTHYPKFILSAAAKPKSSDVARHYSQAGRWGSVSNDPEQQLRRQNGGLAAIPAVGGAGYGGHNSNSLRQTSGHRAAGELAWRPAVRKDVMALSSCISRAVPMPAVEPAARERATYCGM